MGNLLWKEKWLDSGVIDFDFVRVKNRTSETRNVRSLNLFRGQCEFDHIKTKLSRNVVLELIFSRFPRHGGGYSK